MTINQYEVGATILFETTIQNQAGVAYDPTVVSGMILTPSGIASYYTVQHGVVGQYSFKYKIEQEGEFTYAFVSDTPSTADSTFDSGFFIGILYNPTALDYLIPQLRDHLGDRETKQYSTDFLRQSLLSAFKALIPRWRYRYVIDEFDNITRHPDAKFIFAAPPVIQKFDERPIILMAAITIKRGVLQSNAFKVGSWRDDEISVSTIAGGDILRRSLEADEVELESLLPVRTNKLAHSRKHSMVGFESTVINIYEDSGDNQVIGAIPTIST